MNFFRIFKNTLADNTNGIAVFDNERVLTYGDLGLLVDLLSRVFRKHGIQRGTCVAFYLQNTIGFVATFLALCKIRAISVFFDNTGTSEEIIPILEETNSSAIITNEEDLKCCLALLDRISSDTRPTVIEVGCEEKIRIVLLETMSHTPLVEDHADDNDGALYQYTSGITGYPKCVVRSHKNIIHAASNLASTIGYQNTDRIVCTTPLYHAYALNTCLLSVIHAGASLVLVKKLNPLEIIRTVNECLATILVSVPYLYRFLSRFRPKDDISLNPVKFCISGGGVSLPAETAKEFSERFHIIPLQLYGSTESAEISFHRELPHLDYLTRGSLINNVELKIVNTHGEILPEKEIGEIVVRSSAVSPGYKNANNSNSAIFDNGWYRTGDSGFIDKNSNINIIGRQRATISVSGKKVDPKEVENVLKTHPKIKEAVVTGEKNAVFGEVVKAIVVTQNSCSQRELVRFCKSHLAHFKIPRIFDFRNSLPTSATGKIVLKKLI